MIQHSNKPSSSPDEPNRGNRLIRRLVNWLPILLIISVPLIIRTVGGEFASKEQQVTYSEFLNQLELDNIDSVSIQEQQIVGEWRQATTSPDDDSTEFATFTTYLPSVGDDALLSELRSRDVVITASPPASFSIASVVMAILPYVLFLGIGLFLFRSLQSQGQQAMSIRKSTAKQYEASDKRTTFIEVAGQDTAKRELEEVIRFLKEPERFERLGGEIPRGVLLVGPPGTGKTLLARAAAGEADVPFFSVTGSDFMEMFVGVGASRVRDLFNHAKKVAPSIIFVDELDSIGRRRGTGIGGGHDEREQTLNQLLSEMDGFDQSATVVVIAATNRPDVLDSALLRAGRFDRQITVNLPTQRDREAILTIHSKNKRLHKGIDLSRVARSTTGFSGADLKNLLNEAALLAARDEKDAIYSEDIENARDKIIMGLAREGLNLSEHELNMIAYHEAGHALVAALMPQADPLHKVTIIPRGRAMGVTQQMSEQEKFIYDRDYMLDRLAVMMGGRAAENIVFDTATSGAANDFQQAISLARQMVLEWGMSTLFENMALGSPSKDVFLGEQLTQRREYSETTAREVDQEVKNILDEAFNRAYSTLETYRVQLDTIADALLEEEEITGERIHDILDVAMANS